MPERLVPFKQDGQIILINLEYLIFSCSLRHGYSCHGVFALSNSLHLCGGAFANIIPPPRCASESVSKHLNQ